MYQNIPTEMRELPQWVVAHKDKNLYSPRSKKQASVSNPGTWGTFDEAVASGFPYIGFVLTPEDPYCIIDLDDSPEKPCTADQRDRHLKLLASFDSYTERSMSGTGYHIIVKGSIPAGVKRDKVEVYSSERYMICTGNVVKAVPIRPYQELLDILVSEMSIYTPAALEEEGETLTDSQILEIASNAENADKFNTLCSGDITGYPSQSEADFALLSILAFYSKSNEQIRRLFRMSALGKREKATKNDKYLNYAIQKIRGQQQPKVDLDSLQKNTAEIIAKLKDREQPLIQNAQSLPMPPGLVGELTEYFYSTAIRPVYEVALAAALAVTSGVAGRAYNISGTGLNQYLVLLARTGSGKEGALTGIDSLFAAVRPSVPMIDQFMGPAAFASGQALIKVLNTKPGFVSVLGEFGLTLQRISDHNANAADIMLRKVLLDLYTKSGWARILQSSVYSDTEKNTAIVRAPSVTILGESTPETFFDGLDNSHIAEGLIPRFSIIEYMGQRPPRNSQAGFPPETGLVQRFGDLVATCLTTSNNHSFTAVKTRPQALTLLDQFDAYADEKINKANQEATMQLWNRAHLKALKLSALLAVGLNPYRPEIEYEFASWACDFVVKDIDTVSSRFITGDVGKGDSKQLQDLKRIITQYLKEPSETARNRFAPLIRAGMIPYAYLLQRSANLASYKQDRLGATNALKKTVQSLIDSGELITIDSDTTNRFGVTGVVYGLANFRVD